MSKFFIEQKPQVPTPPYTYIKTEEQARTALSTLDNYPVLEVDTEGTALDPYLCKTTLLQIGIPGHAYIFDTRTDLPDVSIHGSLFKDILEDKSKLKILQNANYDMKVLKVQFDYYIENVYDTMLAEQTLNLGRLGVRASLDKIVERYLGLTLEKDVRSSFSKYGDPFTKNQLDYAARDVCTLDIIRLTQEAKLKLWGLIDVLKLETKFLKPLCEMELNGIILDSSRWMKIMAEAKKDMTTSHKEVMSDLFKVQLQNTLFDVPTINIDSPAQLITALHRLGIEVESTDATKLMMYKGLPVIDNILAYRKYNKLLSTYAETLVSKIHSKTGRLHTAFKQLMSTGRLSSNDPNLQNIPGKQIYRSCYKARPGYVLVTADMSGAELRILGNMSLEPTFIEAYAQGIDLHTLNASRIFSTPYAKVTGEQRKASKAISFGLCIDEDVQLLTNQGYKKIKDVCTKDIVAHDVGSDEVLDKKYMGEKECFQIKTKYGYTLRVTKDHLIKVIDGNGKYIDKRLEDIDQKIDYICLKKGAGIFSDETQESLNTNTAAFLGLLVSEGSILKVKNKEAHVPDCIKKGTEKTQVEFIKWLFKGGNTCKSNEINCSIQYLSKSKTLINDLQLMLLNMDILTSNRIKLLSSYPEEKYYVLSIIGKDSYDNFMSKIGFIANYKKIKCNITAPNKPSCFSLPNQSNLLKAITNVYNRSKNKNTKIYNCIRNSIIDTNSSIGCELFKKLIPYDKSNFLDFIEKNNIVMLPIKSIKSVGVRKVYDISVENHQYFLANGFIVHNCYGLSSHGLSLRLGISKSKAQKMIDSYFSNNPKVKSWLTKVATNAVTKGYSESISGRKRFYNVPKVRDEKYNEIIGAIQRQGMNQPVQGCLVGDTYIKGIGSIKQCVGKEFSINTGLGIDKGKGVYSGKQELFRVTLDNGMSLDITDNHIVPTVKPDNVYDVPVKELKIGDKLMVDLAPTFGTATDLSGFTYTKNKNWRSIYKVTIPKIMRPRLAFILGCLVQNGKLITIKNRTTFSCLSKYESVIEEYIDCVRKVFKCRMYIKTNQARTEVTIANSAVNTFLEYCSIKLVKKEIRCIPSYFFTESYNNVSAFLKGVFSCYPSLNPNGFITLNTGSSQLSKGLQQLLLCVGVHSYIRTCINSKYKENDCLIIKREMLHTFRRNIGIAYNVMDTKLKKMCSSKSRLGTGYVPEFIPKMLYKALQEQLTNKKFRSINGNRRHLFSRGKSKPLTWKRYWRTLPDCFEKEFLSIFVDKELRSIVSIERIPINETYDIVCDNIHYFVANGIVVHNSNADTIKSAMIKCVDRLDRYADDAKLLLTVHDEIIVECKEELRYEIADIVTNSLIDGFADYFSVIPMETDAIISPCWMKSDCINDNCDGTEMKFIEGGKYGEDLVCTKCNIVQC